LSAFEISTVELPPNRYYFVWHACYYPRVLTQDGEFACIDSSQTMITNLRMAFAHPGEVHKEMLDKTPPLYYTGNSIDTEPLVKFYRPFADVLQDIFDEHTLLRGINWISKIPAQLIPYLAYLIGWDIPTFPDQDAKSMDKIRRAILRNASNLQRLKSSRRAVHELFEIFGYIVDLVNTFFLVNGDGRLDVVAPDEEPPKKFAGQSVTKTEICQLEPILADFNDSTEPFGGFNVPLMYVASGDVITLTSYLVKNGSAAEGILQNAITNLSTDPNKYNESVCVRVGNRIIPRGIETVLGSATVLGRASVSVNTRTGQATSSTRSGLPTIAKSGISFDPFKNIISVSFDGSIDFSEASLYVFASYQRASFAFNPPELQQRQSNRFDVDFTSKVNQDIDPRVLDYLISFLFKLKAFHSLLRKIKFPINLTEVYDVTDFTVGGAIRQAPGTDAGELQVPSPIIPVGTQGSDVECKDTVTKFKTDDYDLRKKILDGLEQEHAAWKALDSRPDVPDNLKPIIDSLVRIPYSQPSRVDCRYNPFGQDRVKTNVTTDFDHNPDGRKSVCDLDKKPTPDYTYVGRVRANLDVDPNLDLTEIFRCRPCKLMNGKGAYIIVPNPNGTNYGAILQSRGQQGSRYLGKLYSGYDAPSELIQYIHTPLNHLNEFKKLAFLAIQRPSLEIDKDNWFMPGHRHPYANALESDFTHPDWAAKPWDDEYSLITYDENRMEVNALHARIEVIHGEEYLVFDSAPLTYEGNGLVPDISSFGDQDARSFKITHSIYVEQESRPWVEFELVTETNQSCINPTDAMFVNGLFKSATPQGDYVSGYPADQSTMTIDSSEGSNPYTVRFTYGSGILLDQSDLEYPYHEGFRFDCDCSLFDGSCGSGGSTESGSNVSTRLPCLLDKYRLADGSYDFDCDKLEDERIIDLTELVGICSTLFDGTILSHLCFIDPHIIQEGLFPPFQTFRFRDDYGVIYDGMFEYNNDAIDITCATFSPRVPGEADQGYIEKDEYGRLIYMKRGVMTTIRQVILITDTGYRVVAEGSETKIMFARINDICGETPCRDNNCYHYDCQVVDDVTLTLIGSGSGSI
jgi:hypothetical protein